MTEIETIEKRMKEKLRVAAIAALLMAGAACRSLLPNTEYEVEFRVRGSSGEGDPAHARFRTGPAGESGKVVPFPKR